MSPIQSNIKAEDVGSPFEDAQTFAQLPFPYLRLHWVNGNPQAERAGAKYFGGWQSGSQNTRDDMTGLDVAQMPTGFVEATWVSHENKEYEAFSSRTLYFAPILCKDDWWDEADVKRGGIIVKRHRTDFLGYLGDLVTEGEKKYIKPYGPVVLSAHGFAASSLIKAVKDFHKETSKGRAEFAPGVHETFFFVPLGSFGDKRVSMPAGTSSYVPVQFKHYDEWTEGLLTSIFVGDEIAQAMLDLRAKAQEWYEDTRANRAKSYQEPGAGSMAAPDPFEGPDPIPPTPSEGDLPF